MNLKEKGVHFIMKFGFGTGSSLGHSIKDIPGFYKANRFIVLTSVTSNTIPNILDMVFNLLPGGTSFIEGTAKKTKVLVINRSEVYGTYRNASADTRTRSVFIHHGIADCDVDHIQGDTPITFHDVDYNILCDAPDAKMIGKRNGQSYRPITETTVSYDTVNDGVQRDTNHYEQILIPSPEFYDERDMVLLGDREENYMDTIMNSKENKFTMDSDSYLKSLYTLTLNDLSNTNPKPMIYKLNIHIENLTNTIYGSFHVEEDINELVTELAAEVKFHLEKSGFSGAEIIFDGDKGYNVSKLKTYMDMDDFEKRINWLMLNQALNDLNMRYFEDNQLPYSLILTLNYANVKATLVNKTVSTADEDSTSDSDVNSIAGQLKMSYGNYGGFIGMAG